MAKVRPQSFPLTKSGIKGGAKATDRFRNKLNSMAPISKKSPGIGGTRVPYNLNEEINNTVPDLMGEEKRPMSDSANTFTTPEEKMTLGIKQGQSPGATLTSSFNPGSVLSSGYNTSFSRNNIPSPTQSPTNNQGVEGLTRQYRPMETTMPDLTSGLVNDDPNKDLK